MSAIIEINPTIAKRILDDAFQKGLPVEKYLREVIESEDERLKAMREAMQDKLFLADLEEIAEDFHRTDFE
jgi:hypothetical protein